MVAYCRSRDRRAPARGEDHRDLARASELSALAAPAAFEEPCGGEEGPAHGDVAGAGAPRRQTRASALTPSPDAAVLRPRPICRAASPLSRAFPTRAGAGPYL